MMESSSITVPPILIAIKDQYALDWHGLHGVTHWARVYENGLRIANAKDFNLNMLLLFALFHDSRRVNDSIDPGHGRRGAELAAKFRGSYFELTDEKFDLLFYACESHTDGLTEGDISVQVCWDSVRLDLARVKGFTPKPEKLCTETAKDREIIEWASARARSTFVPELLGKEWGQKF